MGSQKPSGLCPGHSKGLAPILITCLPPPGLGERVLLALGPEGLARLLLSCLILAFTEFLQDSIVVSVKFSCYMLFCGVITKFKREILKVPCIL